MEFYYSCMTKQNGVHTRMINWPHWSWQYIFFYHQTHASIYWQTSGQVLKEPPTATVQLKESSADLFAGDFPVGNGEFCIQTSTIDFGQIGIPWNGELIMIDNPLGAKEEILHYSFSVIVSPWANEDVIHLSVVEEKGNDPGKSDEIIRARKCQAKLDQWAAWFWPKIE